MPYFSIITPTFNRIKQLPELVKCVLGQDFNDFELIIIDDGSTDETNKLIHDIIEDPRIHYHRLAKNSGGPAHPRNYGIQKSMGKWLCFLDADDLWTEDKLSKIYSLCSDESSIEVICHDEIMINKSTGKQKYLRYGPFTKNFYENMLLKGNRLSTSATTVKRSFLSSKYITFNEDSNFRIVEDYDFWLQLAKHNANFYFYNRVLGYYIVDNNGISFDHKKSLNNLYHLLKTHILSLDKPASTKNRILKKVTYSIEFSKIIYFLKENNFRLFFKGAFILLAKSPILFVANLAKRFLKLNT
jgi:glycosyltransferase involved in cell wall biosynthesis